MEARAEEAGQFLGLPGQSRLLYPLGPLVLLEQDHEAAAVHMLVTIA
ncbi:MAG: hypothetical protein U0794_03180 [Isosphaeraceae bacterium]